ncbi:MAG: NADPH-dependent 7-cyano-7-deazaguanine reductase QueF [Moraxellaceae bacterium]|nr:NADPH-dependent 7-cyano-7-deazaguanine reductase QueF [Moraxellaceae bacterium]
MQNNTQTHGVLGESTSYPTTYTPTILYPIARSLGRDEIITKSKINPQQLTLGIDWWHCFELSWLNPLGISQVATMRLAIPATSKFIIESKSLKLYLNSFNFTEFQSVEEVKNTIEQDLSNALQTQVIAEIFSIDDNEKLAISQVDGICIDDSLNHSNKKIAIVDDVTSQMLTTASDTISKQSYHSHLLRSNCPVTNQPDWGTVQIDITSAEIDKASLLEYILTYRQHNGFHEQCVEQIFADLTQKFAPTQLMVRAWYTRRGGIDINPCRVSHSELMPNPSRLIRQ